MFFVHVAKRISNYALVRSFDLVQLSDDFRQPAVADFLFHSLLFVCQIGQFLLSYSRSFLPIQPYVPQLLKITLPCSKLCSNSFRFQRRLGFLGVNLSSATEFGVQIEPWCPGLGCFRPEGAEAGRVCAAPTPLVQSWCLWWGAPRKRQHHRLWESVQRYSSSKCLSVVPVPLGDPVLTAASKRYHL